MRMSRKKNPSDIIDSVADGLHVFSHLPPAALVLLHQANDDGASFLAIVGVVIHVVQLDGELRVHPEGVWK